MPSKHKVDINKLINPTFIVTTEYLLTLSSQQLKIIMAQLRTIIPKELNSKSNATFYTRIVEASIILITTATATTTPVTLIFAIIPAMFVGAAHYIGTAIANDNGDKAASYSKICDMIDTILKTREQDQQNTNATSMILSELNDNKKVAQPANEKLQCNTSSASSSHKHHHKHVSHHSLSLYQPALSIVVNDSEHTNSGSLSNMLNT